MAALTPTHARRQTDSDVAAWEGRRTSWEPTRTCEVLARFRQRRVRPCRQLHHVSRRALAVP